MERVKGLKVRAPWVSGWSSRVLLDPTLFFKNTGRHSAAKDMRKIQDPEQLCTKIRVLVKGVSYGP